MMAQTLTNPRDSSTSPAAADERWVILNCYGCGVPGADGGDRVTADAKTVADSCTSTGRHFRVSMGLAPPPAFSYLYHAMVGSSSAPTSAVDENDDDGTGSSDFSQVVAAHGNSVLFLMSTEGGPDYFVYTAGGDGSGGTSLSRPPRLILLPESRFPYLYQSAHRRDDDDDSVRALNLSDTGLLWRGEDEFLVAQLEVPFGEPRVTAEICVLRVAGGGGGWELNKAVPIVQEHGGSKVHVLRDWWETVAVIPVGDRYLCWLNYLTGFLVCDMAAADPPKLRYVRLPADLVGDDDEEANEEYTHRNDAPPRMKHSRNMCAAGASTVRLVSVDSRCCCGGPGWGTCKRSRFAFTVTTWTLELRTTATETEEPMTWVRDGVLDCEELWALPEYGSLPRVPLEYPVVSSDEPDVVCFRVCNYYSRYLDDEHRKDWLLEVDTRRKRLRSVLPTTIPSWKKDSDNIQAKFHY